MNSTNHSNMNAGSQLSCGTSVPHSRKSNPAVQAGLCSHSRHPRAQISCHQPRRHLHDSSLTGDKKQLPFLLLLPPPRPQQARTIQPQPHRYHQLPPLAAPQLAVKQVVFTSKPTLPATTPAPAPTPARARLLPCSLQPSRPHRRRLSVGARSRVPSRLSLPHLPVRLLSLSLSLPLHLRQLRCQFQIRVQPAQVQAMEEEGRLPLQARQRQVQARGEAVAVAHLHLVRCDLHVRPALLAITFATFAG